MPEAALMGPDGQTAIDATTGLPLTMEELLRRRGILAMKGVVSPLNQGATPVATTPADQALADASAATSANSNGSTAAIGSSPNAVDANGVPIGATPATPTNLANSPVGPDGNPLDGSNIWPYVAGGGALAAAAYGASKLRRGVRAPNAAIDSGANPNPNLYREPDIIDGQFTEIVPTNERIGSNRKLDKLIDSKNVAHAGEAGAGPKALSGTAPVTDVSNDNSLSSSVARRNLQDYNTRAPVSTRMQNAARQSNNSRVQPRGSTPIPVTDQYTDMSPEEMGLAKQLASRIRTDRVGGAAARERGVRTAGRGAGLPAPAPVYDQSSELTEAVRLVRQMRAQGVNTHMLAPLVRRLR